MQRSFVLSLVTWFAACVLSVAGGAEGFWPAFQGPRGDNLSDDTGLLQQWPEGGPPLVWKAEGMGEGYATVTVADGMIFTAGNIEEKTVVIGLSSEGEIRFQVQNGEAWTGSHPGTRGTPTIDGNRLYHESPLGDVVCLELPEGKPLWSLNILKDFGGEVPTWALAESLVIDGDRVIACPFGADAGVVALDKATGEVVWKSAPTGHGAGYSTPAIIEQDGLRMILVLDAKGLVAVNADSGELLFQVPHETRYDVNALKPIYHEGRVFVTSGYGAGSAMFQISVDGAKASAEKLWDNKDLDNHHGGVVLLDGYLYGADFKNQWRCLEWATGKTVYSETGVGKGSLTYAEGMLYTLSEKNKMGLVPATPEGHRVVSQFDVPSGGEGPSWAYPVVTGGRLYIRHANTLFCYDVKAE